MSGHPQAPRAMLIRHAHVITMNATRDVHADGFVQTGADGAITAVGPAQACPADFAGEVVDAAGMLVTPGLIDAEHHHWQHLLPGLPPTVTSAALERCGRAFTDGDLGIAASLAAVEMLSGGTTCVFNHLAPGQGPDALRASVEPMARLGLRQVTALDFDLRHADAAAALVRRWHGSDEGRLSLAMRVNADAASVASGAATEAQLLAAYDFARRHDLRISTRLAPHGREAVERARQSTGRSAVMHLMELGLLDDRWLLSRVDSLGDADVSLMRESGCHAVHTPMADALRGIGSGVWTTLQRAGVPLALGTGGSALTGSADMVEQMKAAVLIQNTLRLDAAACSAEAALEMATLGAARALGLQSQIGSLEPGKRADIAVFDMRGAHFQVAHKPISNFISCGRGADAHLVLVDGHVRWRAGVPPAWHGADLVAQARLHSARLMQRAPLEH